MTLILPIIGSLLGALVGGGLALAGSWLQHRRSHSAELKVLLWREATTQANLFRSARHAAIRARNENKRVLTETERQEYWIVDVGFFMLPGSNAVEAELRSAVSATKQLLACTGADESSWEAALDAHRDAFRAFEQAVQQAIKS